MLIPLAVWAGSPISTRRHRAHFVILTVAGLYGLLPLLFRPEEYLIKIGLVVVYLAAVVPLHLQQTSSSRAGLLPLSGGLSAIEVLYLVGYVALEAYCSFAHQAVLGLRLPFVPLMLTSAYCALGITWVWVNMAWSYAWQVADPSQSGY